MENVRKHTEGTTMKSKLKIIKRGRSSVLLEVKSLDILSDPVSLERQLFFNNRIEKLICNGNNFSRVIREGVSGPFIEDKNASKIVKSFVEIPMDPTLIIYYDEKIGRIIVHEVSRKADE